MRLILIAAFTLSLGGCSSLYRTSAVVSDGENVRVLPMTPDNIAQANRAPFTPQTLPAVFSQTAGTGAGMRASVVLPDPPALAELRPGQMDLRLPPPASPGPYAIGVGDVVLLSTPATGSTLEELSGLLAAQNARQGYTVQDDGSINIPNVGRVRIAGLTVEDAEAALFQQLVESQIDPTFSLEIAEFNARKVSIGGEVGSPTVVPITLTPLYLDEALAAAGGVTITDQDFVSIRLFRDGALYQIPLTALYSRAGVTRTRLVEGDAIFVDTTYDLGRAEVYFQQQITLAEARQTARQLALDELTAEVALRRAALQEARENYQTAVALGQDDRDYVYLTGEVGEQGRFALPYGRRARLADALFDQARGIASATGDVSQIYVLRSDPSVDSFTGTTAWHLDARNAANFAFAAQFELRPNDIIFVAQQPITTWDRTVSQILPSLLSVSDAAAGN